LRTLAQFDGDLTHHSVLVTPLTGSGDGEASPDRAAACVKLSSAPACTRPAQCHQKRRKASESASHHAMPRSASMLSKSPISRERKKCQASAAKHRLDDAPQKQFQQSTAIPHIKM
jgi:hypothetical protein